MASTKNLSPRTRGNPLRSRVRVSSGQSIPAHAGGERRQGDVDT